MRLKETKLGVRIHKAIYIWKLNCLLLLMSKAYYCFKNRRNTETHFIIKRSTIFIAALVMQNLQQKRHIKIYLRRLHCKIEQYSFSINYNTAGINLVWNLGVMDPGLRTGGHGSEKFNRWRHEAYDWGVSSPNFYLIIHKLFYCWKVTTLKSVLISYSCSL